MSDAIYLSFVLAFIAKTKISEYLSTCLLHFQGEQHSPHRCRHSWPVRSGANIILSFFSSSHDPEIVFATLHFLGNLRMRPNKLRIVPGKPFQPGVMINSSLLGPFESYEEKEARLKSNNVRPSLASLSIFRRRQR
jgi:hypothetical protein